MISCFALSQSACTSAPASGTQEEGIINVLLLLHSRDHPGPRSPFGPSVNQFPYITHAKDLAKTCTWGERLAYRDETQGHKQRRIDMTGGNSFCWFGLVCMLQRNFVEGWGRWYLGTGAKSLIGKVYTVAITWQRRKRSKRGWGAQHVFDCVTVMIMDSVRIPCLRIVTSN